MRGKTNEIFKRNNLLVEFLRGHKGEQNCVSSSDIAKYLNAKGYYINKQSVYYNVTRLMFERTLPICHKNAKGYYWAETQEDIKASIKDLQGRIEEMQARIEHLKHFIIF